MRSTFHLRLTRADGATEWHEATSDGLILEGDFHEVKVSHVTSCEVEGHVGHLNAKHTNVLVGGRCGRLIQKKQSKVMRPVEEKRGNISDEAFLLEGQTFYLRNLNTRVYGRTCKVNGHDVKCGDQVALIEKVVDDHKQVHLHDRSNRIAKVQGLVRLVQANHVNTFTLHGDAGVLHLTNSTLDRP